MVTAGDTVLYSHAFARMPSPALIVERDGTVVAANEAALRRGAGAVEAVRLNGVGEGLPPGEGGPDAGHGAPSGCVAVTPEAAATNGARAVPLPGGRLLLLLPDDSLPPKPVGPDDPSVAAERRRMEEELAHERYLLRTLMDNIPDLIYFKDTGSRFTRINGAQVRNLGVERAADALGKTDFDFFPDEQASAFYADEQAILATGEPLINRVERQTRPDGSVGWNLSTKVPIRDADGAIVGLVGVTKDITERVRAEEALERAAEELRRTAAELRRSNEDLQQFAYVASHDLQEPLRMVASYTQLLARRYRDRLDGDANEFIRYAVDGATRMQALINDLLQYSRVGTRGAVREPAPMEAVVAAALANLEAALEESGASVTHGELPCVRADAAQVTQLVQNLIGNALKFRTDEPPRVRIDARAEGDQWLFSVRDNGIGVDPECAGRIFAIFQRLHARERYPGSGIGLAICKKIVERHGGRIWVEPNPEGGSTFFFTLPADPAEHDDDSERSHHDCE